MNCPCGLPLHYSNPDSQRIVEAFVERYGETVVVEIPEGKWRVPRHYIALHGIATVTLPAVCDAMGFERVDDDDTEEPFARYRPRRTGGD